MTVDNPSGLYKTRNACLFFNSILIQIQYSCLLHPRWRHTDSVLGSSVTAAVTMSHPRCSQQKQFLLSNTFCLRRLEKSPGIYIICPHVLLFQCAFICVIECIGFWISTSCPLILRWKIFLVPLYLSELRSDYSFTASVNLLTFYPQA